MSEQHWNEQLSCYMDGELNKIDSGQLLQKTLQSPGLTDKWQRYYHQRHILRDQAIPTLSANFNQRLAQKLAAEPTIVTRPIQLPDDQSGLVAFIKKPSFAWATAASIALVTVLVWQANKLQPTDNSTAIELLAETSAPAQPERAQLMQEFVAQDDTELTDPLLQDYLVEHSVNTISPGVTPYVRLTAYETSQR